MGNVIEQPIDNNKILFHLVTKNKHYEKSEFKRVQNCLKKLRDRCIRENITELHMPHVYSGLDGQNFNTVRELLREVFALDSIYIFIYSEMK